MVENAKSARAFLGALGMPVRELVIEEVGDNRLTGGDVGAVMDVSVKTTQPRSCVKSKKCL